MKRKDSPARKGMKLLCTLLGIIFVVMLGGTLTFRHFLNQIHYTPSQPKEDQNILAVFSAFSLGSSSDRIGGPGSDLLNILLVGQDAREGEEGTGKLGAGRREFLCRLESGAGNLYLNSQ